MNEEENIESHARYQQWQLEQQEMIKDKAQDEWLDKLEKEKWEKQ